MKTSCFLVSPRSSARLALGATSFAIILLAGCRSVNSVGPAETYAQPHYVPDKRVVTDKSLSREVQVTGINTTTVSGNLRKVQATLVNVKRSATTLNYAWSWVDEAGMTITDPASNWIALRLLGGEQRTISSVAPSPRAVDFVLKLQEGD